MTDPEYYSPDNEIRQALERDETVHQYLETRSLSYDGLIDNLQKLGGRVLFHNSEQLAQIANVFTAGKTVEFSELDIPSDYQTGTLLEDSFIVPLSSIDRPQNLYRPQLCATIQNNDGIVDTLLFPLAKNSDGTITVLGIRPHTS